MYTHPFIEGTLSPLGLRVLPTIIVIVSVNHYPDPDLPHPKRLDQSHTEYPVVIIVVNPQIIITS